MKKYTSVSLVLLLLCLSIFFYACKKDLSKENELKTDTNTVDLTTKINTSVSGFVTDENNNPVQYATVTAGSKTTSTNSFGFFEIKNEMLVRNAAFVTIEKQGYFKGTKTWMITQNQAAFFRIKLLPKVNAGMVSGITGGEVTLSGGMKIGFPAAAFVIAATGAAYSGNVTVNAQWLNPLAQDIDEISPGNKTGIDSDGGLKLLKTFGMANIELRNANGELLQIASGKKATINMPIPSVMHAAAPATIALGYFDDAKGLWKEQGTAVRSGNTYICEVSHFTLWNVNIPGSFVWFSCRMTGSGGMPLGNAFIIIRNQDEPWNYVAGYTDASGNISGAIEANASLQMTVQDQSICYTILYSHSFLTTNVGIALGTINIPAGPSQASVSGTVTNCQGNPVSNGRVFIRNYLYQYEVYPLDNAGAFNVTKMLCSTPDNFTVIAEDLTTLQQSIPTLITLNSGPNVLGNFQACGVNATDFLTYSFNGANYSYAYPDPSAYTYCTEGSPGLMTEFAGNGGNNFYFRYNMQGITTNSAQVLNGISFTNSADSLVFETLSYVHITEYGPVGQYISGNFSATVHKVISPAIIFPIICNFRSKRY